MTDANERRPKDDAEGEEEREAIARRLSEVLGATPTRPPDEDVTEGEGGDRTRGRLRLDKTGALADRPKLEPKRPYGRTGREAPGPEGSGETAGGTRDTGPRKATIPPPLSTLRPPDLPRPEEMPAVEEVLVPGGEFLYGEDPAPRDLGAFRIDRRPVTHEDYEVFVRHTGHRPPLYWPDGVMPEEIADHPVVGVDYYDALAYAQWVGKDLPFEDEWERAARGVDGRTYPWGNDAELGQANTARLGHKMTLPVEWFSMNVSPDGVSDTVGNVWEITHSPAPGGGVVVRGGSWYDFVLYAKTWFRFASRPDARNGTIGFRCVRRDRPRRDAVREIDPEIAAAEIAARRGSQPMPPSDQFAAERRDLVPDYRRLKHLRAEKRAEDEHDARDRGPGPAAIPRRPAPRPVPGLPPQPPPSAPPARKPVRATPPPPIARPPKTPPPPKPPKPPEPPEPKPPARPEKAIDRAGLQHAADMATKGAIATEDARADRLPDAGTPLLYWTFLGVALVLVVTFLVLLISGVIGGGGEPAPPVTVANGGGAVPEPGPRTLPPRPIPRLPPAPDAHPRDADPARWFDGAKPGWDMDLAEGVWLVVFLEAYGPEAALSVRTASNLHRRMRDRGAELLVVFPRRTFLDENGRLLSLAERTDALRRMGGVGDLNILLDAPDGSSFDGALRARYRVRDPYAALVLVDGRREHRTAPLNGGFTLDDLEPLAVRATEIRPPAGD